MTYATKDDELQPLSLAYQLIALIEIALELFYKKIWMEDDNKHIMLKYDVMLNKLYLYSEVMSSFYL